VTEFGLAGAIIDQFGGEDTAGTEVAMVSALSTENAALLGTAGSPQDVAQAVAGTMTRFAMVSGGTGLPEETEESERTQTMEAFDTQLAGTTLPVTATVLQTLDSTATRIATSIIEKTSTPEATSTPYTTPVPPTSTNPPEPTATPDVCGAINIHGFIADGQELDWTISNGSGGNIRITSLYINWPEGNQVLKKIELNGSEIWSGEDEAPPTNISSGMKGNRLIGTGQSKTLHFYFDQEASSSGYSLEVGFDNGCSSQQSK
jgi:hypothetical protein